MPEFIDVHRGMVGITADALKRLTTPTLPSGVRKGRLQAGLCGPRQWLRLLPA